jgi:hypothetical protein
MDDDAGRPTANFRTGMENADTVDEYKAYSKNECSTFMIILLFRSQRNIDGLGSFVIMAW